MERSFAVIGVGNMARAIIAGITSAGIPVSKFYLFDKNSEAYKNYNDNSKFYLMESISDAVKNSDCVLLSVKPQNYSEVISELKTIEGFEKKLYISIGAGITAKSVSEELCGAKVIRVLPNLPMTIGMGVSVICKNDAVAYDDFEFVKSVFDSAGTTTIIDESDMNAIIGVTSSSPAYVFKFINAICCGAEAQGLRADAMLDVVCDMVIGSAMLLKQSADTPSELISKVASKGGTTEQALIKLNEGNFDKIIENAMIACTKRADELGKK